ncbi:hypothetical protein M6B38_329020 [Iris pallida]|uniref:Uncharacterized protein n=1 Tax=Iris pallida TaxID=29817 RepID=A0AAX6H583_IRIPA|nr:hypothetical protein M6B38_329020 [Iris pallida]
MTSIIGSSLVIDWIRNKDGVLNAAGFVDRVRSLDRVFIPSSLILPSRFGVGTRGGVYVHDWCCSCPDYGWRCSCLVTGCVSMGGLDVACQLTRSRCELLFFKLECVFRRPELSSDFLSVIIQWFLLYCP